MYLICLRALARLVRNRYDVKQVQSLKGCPRVAFTTERYRGQIIRLIVSGSCSQEGLTIRRKK